MLYYKSIYTISLPFREYGIDSNVVIEFKYCIIKELK